MYWLYQWLVIKKLLDKKHTQINCEICRYALIHEPQTHDDIVIDLLIAAKNKNVLFFPSKSVNDICLYTEQMFRYVLNQSKSIPSESNFYAVLCLKVIHDLIQSPYKLFTSLYDHVFDDTPEEGSHLYSLIKCICLTYISLTLYSATKIFSNREIGTKIRHDMNRKIIWNHQ